VMRLVGRKALQLQVALTSAALVLSVFVFAPAAQAAVFSMTGDMQLFQPSVGFANPSRVKTLPSPNRGSRTVSQTGFGTGVPDTLRIGSNIWELNGWPNQTANGAAAIGTKFRSFPGLPGFAQVSTTFSTTHGPVTFKAGQGAGAIDWCPYNTGCMNYVLGTAYQVRMAITPGAEQFGGTFSLLLNGLGLVWAVPNVVAPISILKIPNNNFGEIWGAGLTNHLQQTNTRMSGLLYVGGSLTTGTNTNPGPNGRIASLGAYLGPLQTSMGATVDLPDYITTAFKMTTGTIRFSDMTPGSPQIDTISGSDTRTPGGQGNITLVGGAMVHGGSSGNLFFNATRLHMSLPEPGYAFGLAAGISVLFALARLRQRS